MSVNFEKMDKALSRLKEATSKDPSTDLERDGIIQRFEYTIELLWKVAKKTLKEDGLEAGSPKEVIREMAHLGWIDNPKELMNFLKLRNQTSHSYEASLANQVADGARDFTLVCEKLVQILKEKSQ